MNSLASTPTNDQLAGNQMAGAVMLALGLHAQASNQNALPRRQRVA